MGGKREEEGARLQRHARAGLHATRLRQWASSGVLVRWREGPRVQACPGQWQLWETAGMPPSFRAPGLPPSPHPSSRQVSEEAKDLVRKLLVVNPAKRLTCEQVLAHPWMARPGVERELARTRSHFSESSVHGRWVGLFVAGQEWGALLRG